MTAPVPFQFTTDLDAYLADLRDHRPGALVPVLGTPGPGVRDVTALSRPDLVRPVDEPGEVVIAWPAGSGAAQLARSLADAVDGVPIELAAADEIGAASGSARHVLLVGLAHEISERWLTAVHDSLWLHRSDGVGGHLGLVVGRTLSELSWIVAKGLALPHRIIADHHHLRVWPAVSKVPRRYGDGDWVLQDDARASVVRPLMLERHTSAVSILAHGRDDVIHLNDTVICPIGAVLRPDEDPSTSHAPVCAFTGHCYRPEVSNADIVLSGEIRADAVLANSCMGMRVNEGLYPADFLMPHGFINGVAAGYLSTGQVINGQLKVNDIFHSACAAGLSLGEAATLMNDHLRYERVDLPYYLLLGLPWLTVAAGRPDATAWDGFLQASGVNGAGGGGVHAAAVAVAAQDLTGGNAHVLYVSPRSAAVLPAGIKELDLATVPDLRGAMQAMGRAMTSLEDVPFTGLRYSRQGNMLVNVRDQITSLTGALHTAALSGDVERIRRRISAIATGVERAQLTLAEALFERGVQSFQHYNDVWGETLELLSPVLTDEECPYCARFLVRQQAVHPVIARIGRDARVCPRCGMVRDIDSRAPVSQLLVETPELWHLEQNSSVRLSFAVDAVGDRPAKVAVGIFMANAAKNGMSFPAPRLVDVDADGRGSIEVDITVPPGARMHQEYVRGLIVAEGTISFVTRPVWVRPATDPHVTGGAGLRATAPTTAR
ncbi:MAG TPA: hypothetical protein VF657_07455 [Actinoplanes sp.]